MTVPHPHTCPDCRCNWNVNDDPGQVNTDAEFYPLVQLCDQAIYNIGPESRKHRKHWLTYAAEDRRGV